MNNVCCVSPGAETGDPVTGGFQLDGLWLEILKSLPDVNGFDMLQVIAACGIDTVGHRRDDTIVDKLVYPAGITEVGRLLGYRLCDGFLQLLSCLRCEQIVITLTRKSDVGGEHRLHLVLIARKDNQHVGIGLGENGEQRVKHAPTEVFLVIGTSNQGIGLVDEEHVALGFFEDGFHVILRLTDILTHQSGTIDSDDFSFGKEPEAMIDLAKLTGDGGLASTGIAREDRVVGLFTAVVQSSPPALMLWS